MTEHIAPDGFRVSHTCRNSLVHWPSRGGGVAILLRESISVSIINLGTFSQFEYVSVKLQSPTELSQITFLHRKHETVSAPSATSCPINSISCYSVVNAMLSAVISTVLASLALGDHLQKVLPSYNCAATVGNVINTLDLIIVPERAGEFVRDVSVQWLLFRYHSLVRCFLGIPQSNVSYTFMKTSSECICSRFVTLFWPHDSTTMKYHSRMPTLFEVKISRVPRPNRSPHADTRVTIAVYFKMKRKPQSARVADSFEGLGVLQKNRSPEELWKETRNDLPEATVAFKRRNIRKTCISGDTLDLIK